MKALTIPTWLYLPMKLLLLLGFASPFVLWGLELEGMTRKSEAALAEQGLRSIEQLGSSLARPGGQAASSESGEYVPGIDVSHYQGDVDWRKVAQTEIRFAYAKATGGTSFVDPYFHHNWQLAREVNLTRGAYHFFLAAEDPIVQAKHFVQTVGDFGHTDLPPVLDVETDDNTDIKTLQERALAWLVEVEKQTGRLPVVYTDNGFADKVLTDSRFARYPLWIADYASAVKNVPSPWASRSWSMWQYEETGKVSGIDGNVDRSRFKGTLADLRAFIKKSRVK